jgi:glycine oxidase
MHRNPDVLVVGGGVIGLAIARALVRPKRSVLAVDRGALGGAASGAAAGVLAVGSGGEEDGPDFALRRAGLARCAPLAVALRDETGIDVEYDAHGVLDLALTDEDEARAGVRVERRRAQGFVVERLDQAALRSAEPHANAAARGAVLFADDARLDPGRLVQALAASAVRRGAEVVPGVSVVDVERSGDRIARVRVGGDWVAPGTVVLASGAWAARFGGFPTPGDVRPARGQMLALRVGAGFVRRPLSRGLGYVVPCRNGELLVGATVEDAGFARAVTPTGVGLLLENLRGLVPDALDAPITRMWSGLRPYAPAGPMLGPAPGTANLLLACGHYRNGILLAAITAEIVAALVDGTAPPAEAAPFLPRGAAGA